MVTLTIDRQIVHVESGTTIFEAARRLGIHIPTCCHHEAIKPYGACRLCTVEIIRNKRFKLVTSCNYPAEQGLEVLTFTERVRKTRKTAIELLLARCPNVPVIQQLAQNMGIKRSRFKKVGDERCILCGLCVRACDEMVGVCAIGFANRGTDREVNTPFQLDSDVCIGCGACTYICPTGCIEMVGRPSPSGGKGLNMGELAVDTCPHDYECATCEIELQFFEEIKRAVKSVRQKKNNGG